MIACLIVNFDKNIESLSAFTELMIRMGFSADEIKESLTNNKYDEVMATYILLDEKRVSFCPYYKPIYSLIFFVVSEASRYFKVLQTCKKTLPPEAPIFYASVIIVFFIYIYI